MPGEENVLLVGVIRRALQTGPARWECSTWQEQSQGGRTSQTPRGMEQSRDRDVRSFLLLKTVRHFSWRSVAELNSPFRVQSDKMMQMNSEPKRNGELLDSSPDRSPGSFHFIVSDSILGMPPVRDPEGWLPGHPASVPCPDCSDYEFNGSTVAHCLTWAKCTCFYSGWSKKSRALWTSFFVIVSAMYFLWNVCSFLAPLIAFCLPNTSVNCGWALSEHQGVNGWWIWRLAVVSVESFS